MSQQTSLGADVEELRRQLAAANAENARLRAEELKYRTIFEAIDEGFCIIEVIFDEHGKAYDLLHLEANEAYARYTGLPDIVGKRAREIVPDGGPWLDFYGQVALTGEPARLEIYMPPGVDRWIASYASRVGGEGSSKVAVVFNDITDRKRAEAALLENEERQAFLLKLSDALRPLTDPTEIQDAAARVVGESLAADRAYYAYVEGDNEFVVVEREYKLPDAPSVIARYSFADFPSVARMYRAGKHVILDDVEAPGASSEVDLTAYRAVSVRSFLGVLLIKQGRPVASVNVLKATPHHWTPQEIALMEETAERTWAAVERARAERRLRDSEERFRQFADASSDALWIRDARTFAFEFVSPAVEQVFGVTPAEVLADAKLINSLILPEEREVVSAGVERIGEGERIVQEYRILRPSDRTFRWIRSTGFPLRDELGRVNRIAAIATDVTDATLAVQHQRVLLSELQHRVRNIMTILRSMGRRTADGVQNVADYRNRLEGRFLAMSRVQALLTSQANAGGSLRGILEAEIGAQAHHSDTFELGGPEVMLGPKAVEVLTLAFHELATNAVKYGAFSTTGGRLSVTWRHFEKRDAAWLSIDWVEQAPSTPVPSARRGFGSELIEARIPYELAGSGTVTITPSGAHCHIEFPLTRAESILETDAPAPANVFGGTLDMAGAPDLSGQRVLVVEDDYYAASDTVAALQGAGAEIVGPCPRAEAALRLLETEQPTAAVVDLNLGGGGPRFEIAHALRGRGIAFIFLTGYDPDVIPPDLAGITRLQKPVPLVDVVSAVAELAQHRGGAGD